MILPAVLAVATAFIAYNLFIGPPEEQFEWLALFVSVLLTLLIAAATAHRNSNEK